MQLPNIFTQEVSDSIISRINKLTSETQPKWGKMNVSQMLGHCCVTYEFIYENKHKKPGFMLRLMLKALVKNSVVNEKPYKTNLRTAPEFMISDNRVFETEKNRLIDFIIRVQKEGEAEFDGKISRSFGKLNKNQWNNMFYKHLDHHLNQFGV